MNIVRPPAALGSEPQTGLAVAGMNSQTAKTWLLVTMFCHKIVSFIRSKPYNVRTNAKFGADEVLKTRRLVCSPTLVAVTQIVTNCWGRGRTQKFWKAISSHFFRGQGPQPPSPAPSDVQNQAQLGDPEIFLFGRHQLFPWMAKSGSRNGNEFPF